MFVIPTLKPALLIKSGTLPLCLEEGTVGLQNNVSNYTSQADTSAFTMQAQSCLMVSLCGHRGNEGRPEGSFYRPALKDSKFLP